MSLYEDITFTGEFITDILQRKIGLASHIYNGQWGVYVVDVSAQFWSTFELFCYCEAMPCKTWYVLWILLPHLCYLLKAFYRWFFSIFWKYCFAAKLAGWQHNSYKSHRNDIGPGVSCQLWWQWGQSLADGRVGPAHGPQNQEIWAVSWPTTPSVHLLTLTKADSLCPQLPTCRVEIRMFLFHKKCQN